MTRVVIHSGFHKTGTSSFQAFCRQNRAVLAPHLDIYLPEDFRDAADCARIYGLKPYPWRRARFGRAFRAFLDHVPENEQILLSCEAFSGVMPGHRRAFGRPVARYRRAAVPLAVTMIQEIHRHLGANTRVEFLLTLRQPDHWPRSVYGHLLRSIRIVDDFQNFKAAFTSPPDLTSEARAIAKALEPAPVHTRWIEEIGPHRLGPASVLLDLFRVPEDLAGGLPDAQHRNAALPPEIEAEFLRLNRQITDPSALKTRKEAIAAAAYAARRT